MDTRRINIHLGRSKDSNWELAEKLGLSKEASSEFSYTCVEVALTIDVNMATGESKIVGCEGKFLGDEEVTSGELDESE